MRKGPTCCRTGLARRRQRQVPEDNRGSRPAGLLRPEPRPATSRSLIVFVIAGFPCAGRSPYRVTRVPARSASATGLTARPWEQPCPGPHKQPWPGPHNRRGRISAWCGSRSRGAWNCKFRFPASPRGSRSFPVTYFNASDGQIMPGVDLVRPGYVPRRRRDYPPAPSGHAMPDQASQGSQLSAQIESTNSPTT